MLNKEDNFDPANTNPYCGQIIIGVNDKERVNKFIFRFIKKKQNLY
jgi:hypothetical protein